MWRRTLAQKLIISALIALLTIYLVCFQFVKFNRVMKRRGPAFLELPRMELEHNGGYWIYHNFMRSWSRELNGNSSVTLTTHGTYRDLKYMTWLLARWSGPISMAVYVHQDDLHETQQYLYYIQYCTSYSLSWAHYVSLHLVFSDKHMPHIFHGMHGSHPNGLRCKEIHISALSSFDHNITYPLHLLRNVARLNAETFYVLPLEPGMLPTKHFVKTFLQFVHLYYPEKPLKSVYCIPVFPQICDDLSLPKYKSQLCSQLQPYLQNRVWLAETELEQLEKWRSWLETSVQDGDMTVYRVTMDPDNCAAYVSSNAYDPLYDQRYAESIHGVNSTKLQVLVGLGFDFIMLDGTFLIYRNTSVQPEYSTDYISKLDYIRQLLKLNTLPLGN